MANGFEPPLPALVHAFAFDLAGGGHDLDDSEDAVHRHTGTGEVDDLVLGDAIAFIGY